MARRNRVGNRRFIATFFQHNGTLDATGTPTFNDPQDWDQFLTGWFCECLDQSGRKTMRGREVTESTKRVLYGDYAAVQNVDKFMRCKVNGIVSEILAVLDENGDQREMVIDLGREK